MVPTQVSLILKSGRIPQTARLEGLSGPSGTPGGEGMGPRHRGRCQAEAQPEMSWGWDGEEEKGDFWIFPGGRCHPISPCWHSPHRRAI